MINAKYFVVLSSHKREISISKLYVKIIERINVLFYYKNEIDH